MQSADSSDVIRAGNSFFSNVVDLDKKKREFSRHEIQAQLNRLLGEFVAQAKLPLNPSLHFGDVHLMMGKKWHTELAYVRLHSNVCELTFHDRLIEFDDPYAGFIFIGKVWVLLLVLSKALEDSPSLSVDFVFEIGDGASLDQVCFTSTNRNACLILDYDFAASNGYSEYRELCSRTLIPWSAREPKVFWRGSTTGRREGTPPPPGSHDNFIWLPRLRLCVAARDPRIAAHCDVAITEIVQMPEDYLAERIRSSGLLRARVPRESFMKYRGAFDIDGNANAWSGLFCSLLGASCVLKVQSASGARQWYYDSLVPWLNHIPILADHRNLPHTIEWFIKHESHASEIAQRGRELAEDIDFDSAMAKSVNNFLSWNKSR